MNLCAFLMKTTRTNGRTNLWFVGYRTTVVPVFMDFAPNFHRKRYTVEQIF